MTVKNLPPDIKQKSTKEKSQALHSPWCHPVCICLLTWHLHLIRLGMQGRNILTAHLWSKKLAFQHAVEDIRSMMSLEGEGRGLKSVSKS